MIRSALRIYAMVSMALLAGMAITPASAESLRLRADYWCPYNCDPGDQYPGYMVEIATRAMARLGMDLDYELMPWDRAMSEVRRGAIDGVIGATSLEADGLPLSDPLGVDTDCFFVAAGNPWRFTGADSLPQVVLGTVSGYTHDEGPIDAYIARNDTVGDRVVTTSGDDASLRNIRLLLLGRVDAILDSNAVTTMEATRAGQAQAIVNAGCLKALPLYIAIAPRHPHGRDIIAALQVEVSELRRSGELAKILGHYGLKDWAP